MNRNALPAQTISGAAELYHSFHENPTQLAAFHGIPIEYAKQLAPLVKARDEAAIAQFFVRNRSQLYVWAMLYGGVRSGKTLSACFRVWMFCARFPGVKMLVVRKRKEQLRNTFLDEFEKVGNLITDGNLSSLGELQPEHDGALEYLVWGPDPKHPSKVIFAIEPDGTDKEVEDRWRGYTVAAAVTEETGQLREITMLTVRSRMSQKLAANGAVIPRWMLSILNPVTRGHYIQKFKQENETDYLMGKRPTCLIIKSKPADNKKHLAEDYEKEQREVWKHDPARAAMLLDGEDGIEINGTPVYGAQFNRNLHVDAKLKFNPYRPLLRGWDFGYHRPACIWAQEDEKGCINILSELLGDKETADQFADRVLALTAEHYPNPIAITDYGDPAGAQQSDKGDTTIARLRMRGIRINYRPSGIDAGIKHIRGLLTKLRGHPARPELCFSPACADLIVGFERGYHYPQFRDGILAHKPKKDGYYEHLMDCARYMLINIRALPFGEEQSENGFVTNSKPLVMQGPESFSVD